jgi:mannose-6-phosphate isomerase-like protein (cupin superfamily)
MMMREKDQRPWGMYEVLDEGNGYKVKRIEVKPGQRLSLQSHENRSEHWVIVSGEAVVTLDEQEIHLQTNEDVLIPAKARHRVANPGQELLVFIEVQCGSYLGEDDIKRYADDYHRAR